MHLPTKTSLQGGKYKIIDKIGQGGFGIAYKARHELLNKVVCVKEFYYRDLCERVSNSLNITVVSTSSEKIKMVSSFKKKFVKEAQRLAAFQHPNIVQVTDVFEENDTAYFVMEYLEGGSLEDKLKDGVLSEEQTLGIVSPLLDALEAVHKEKLLHLDIKPQNIMFRKNGVPVLIDFGISKYMALTEGYTTTSPVGVSKGYAPLEQYGGDVADFTEATDIYSVCASMYFMVTGNQPPEPLQILSKGLKPPQEFNPALSNDFNTLIVRGMSVKQIDRYCNVNDVLNVFNKKLANNENTTFFNHSIVDVSKSFYQLDKYDEISSFSEGLAKVKITDEYNSYKIDFLGKSAKYGFIDKTGKEVIPCKYNDAESFSEGLSAVGYRNEGGFVEWGFIDTKDNKVIKTNGFYVNGFSEGLAPVLNGDLITRLRNGKYLHKTKWGFIDKSSNFVIPFKYESMHPFSEGLTWVEEKKIFKSKWKCIDRKGEEVFSCKLGIFDFKPFSEGLALIKIDDKWGFIDKLGNIVIPCKYDSAESFSDGLAFVSLGQRGIFIDKTGNEVLSFIDGRYLLDGFSEGLASIRRNDKYGFIDKMGNEVIPCKYDFVDSFVEGVAKVQIGDKWGFIDKLGNKIISCKYDEVEHFSEGLAKVKLNGAPQFVDKKGNIVIE